MPIHLEDLAAAEKVHVAVRHDTTWAIAAAALQEKNGNLSWPLVVRKADGTYAAVRYQTVLEAGDVPAETLAESLPGLTPVEAVEMAAIGTDAAWDKVNASKSKVLVVTKARKFAGIMAKGAARGESALPTALLDNLTGGNVDLAKLGSFLLDEG